MIDKAATNTLTGRTVVVVVGMYPTAAVTTQEAPQSTLAARNPEE